VDGRLARKYGQTVFGGLLDMEADAFLILAVGAFATTDPLLGAWTLIPGMLRYVWVLLTFHLPTQEAVRLGGGRAKILYATGLITLLGCALPFRIFQELRVILGVVSCFTIGSSFALDLPGLFQRLKLERMPR
jgi:phosphatidylglycerophosphate synthase